jgi:hypothetical protein
VTNVGTKAVEISAFGMANPAGNGGSDGLKSSVVNDTHMGGSHNPELKLGFATASSGLHC